MKKVLLTDTEVELCELIGKLRYEKTSKSCAEQIQSSRDPLQISIDGVLSEYIVAKYKNWFFDLNCDVRKFGADLIVPTTGHKIDVKSTRKLGGEMNIRGKHKEKDYDYYVLVELDDHHDGIIVGIASRSIAINDENIMVNNFTGLPYYRVPRSKLKVWD
jgi:hypothetical protein